MIIESKVDSSDFQEWIDESVERLRLMKDTLKDIEVIIWQHTMHRVPVRLGYLEESFFKYSEIRSEYPLMGMKFTMTGKDNPTADGWDYALYMHEGKSDGSGFNYTVKGELHYLENGFREAEPYFMKYIESDYLTALGG